MTLPNERTSSVLRTRDFLLKLCTTSRYGGFKGVPKEVREAARSLLRHYPGSFHIDQAAEKVPDVFSLTGENESFLTKDGEK